MFKFSGILPISKLVRSSGNVALTVLRSYSAMLKVAKTAALKIRRRSDYRRWKDPGNCLAWWGTRVEKMANLIPDGSRVLEFGAGLRTLESHLAPNCVYIPSDLVDRGPGTIICDLNKRPLPDLRYLMVHVAVFAGVLEYLNDLPTLIEWLSGQVVLCIVSYECVRSNTNTYSWVVEMFHRVCNGYMSYYRENQLIALFEKSGFVCTNKDTWRDQDLFVFAKSEKKDESQIGTCRIAVESPSVEAGQARKKKAGA